MSLCEKHSLVKLKMFFHEATGQNIRNCMTSLCRQITMTHAWTDKSSWLTPEKWPSWLTPEEWPSILVDTWGMAIYLGLHLRNGHLGWPLGNGHHAKPSLANKYDERHWGVLPWHLQCHPTVSKGHGCDANKIIPMSSCQRFQWSGFKLCEEHGQCWR